MNCFAGSRSGEIVGDSMPGAILTAAWVAVRVMVPRKGVNQVMDGLYAIGARAILVTAIHNARL